MARSKLTLLGLLERTVKLYHEDKLSIDEITKRYKDEGIDVSRSAIGRTVKSHAEWMEEDRRIRQEATLMLEQYKDTPNTDLMEMVQNMLQVKLADYMRSVDSIDFKEPAKLFESMAALSRSQVNVSRLRMEYQDGVSAAKRQLETELTEMLKEKDPALLKRLVEMVRALRIENAARGRR